MGKKAPRRNAFYCYMLDYKRREEARGVRFPNGLADVSKLAGESWKLCPQEIKDSYKKKADEYNKSEERNQAQQSYYGNKKKKKPEPAPPNRALTLKEAKQRHEKQLIKNLVEEMTINDLLDCFFYLAHVNVFCKTADDEFVPAEIAISRFSLREGVTDVFHRILNPGVTPLGYSYTIKEHCEKTHRIPLDFVKATKGYLGIYKGITDFLQPRGNPERMPILYTMFDEPFHNCSMSAVKYSLKRIWETCNVEDDEEDGELTEYEPYEKVFRVMSLPILFFHLKNKCASVLDVNAVAFENTSEANIELLNDKYEFNEEMACQFHIDIDNVRYCSQSYVVRWAQVIREQCLKNLESDEEEEEEAVEEEQMAVTVEVDKLKLECDSVVKKEKTEESQHLKSKSEIKKEKDCSLSYRPEIKDERHERERDDRQIKRERDDHEIKKERDDREIKKERDDREIKKERDDREIKKERDDHEIKKERDDREIKKKRDEYSRSSEDSRVKKEREDRCRDYEDSRRKSEGDGHHRSFEDSRYKKERNRGYDDERIKKERDRGYDEVRVKKERDRGYDDTTIKKEKDRGCDNVCTKNEREDRHRSSETHSCSRIKLEKVDPDYDQILKPEHLDIPLDVKVERSDIGDSHPCDTKKYSEISCESTSSEEAARSDSNSKVKLEHLNVKKERPDNENIDLDYDSLLKTEHLDIPLDIKPERIDSRNLQVPDSNRFCDSTISEQNPPTTPLKKEHSDFPLPIKEEFPTRTEGSSNGFQTSSASETKKGSEFPQRIKASHSNSKTSVSSDLPTIQIKKEREFPQQTEPLRDIAATSIKEDRDSDFPLPIPIKKELPPQTEPSRSNATTSKATDIPTTPIKEERDPEFPLPIPIKQEFPPSTEPSRSDSRLNKKSNPPSLIEDPDDFPLPKRMKIEPPESNFSSVRIKEEPTDSPDVKNEEIEIVDEDIVPVHPTPSMPERMEYTTTYTEKVMVKK